MPHIFAVLANPDPGLDCRVLRVWRECWLVDADRIPAFFLHRTTVGVVVVGRLLT